MDEIAVARVIFLDKSKKSFSLRSMYLPPFLSVRTWPNRAAEAHHHPPGWSWSLVAGWLLVLATGNGLAQSFVISEFMAANSSNLRDEDGDFSDWIEIYNSSSQPASIQGWYLTDSAGNLAQWQFPAVTIPGNQALLVFASGKDRTVASGQLHTNFKLDASGEYLALVRPDGVTVESEFGPTYPPQVTDVSYGRVMATHTNQWIAPAAAGRFLSPTTAAFGQTWLQAGFDDSAWMPVTLGIGYYRSNDVENPPEPGVPLEDVSRPGDIVVPTSSNSPGSEGVDNAIDDTSATKYLNFDKLNTGFAITLTAGKKIVIGLRLTSANDAPERDPTSYILSGSNDGQNWAEIARGTIPDFQSRFCTVTVSFTNTVAYSHFKLIFPTVRNAAGANSMQISEVEFLGLAGDLSTGLLDYVRSDVESALFGRASGYLRVPFVVPDPQEVGPLTLRVHYEDGFIAYLNGVEVARANAPVTPAFDALSPTNRYRFQAVQEQHFDLSPYAGLIRAGTNLLALQGFNDRTNSPDFLLDAQLETARVSMGESAYFLEPTPGGVNSRPSLGWVAPVQASPERQFLAAPFAVQLYCPTPGASIYYTTNGTEPTPTSGFPYTASLHFKGTTTLRAAAFAQDWAPSEITTHTYIVLEDVITQSQSNALDSGFPLTWNGQPADYGLDPRVVGRAGTDNYGGKYSASIVSDLKAVPTLSIVMDSEDLFGLQGIYSNPDLRGDAWERPASIELIYPDGREGFQENTGLTIQGGAFRGFNLTLKKSFRVIFSEKYGKANLHFRLFDGADATDHFDTFTLRAGSNDAWPYDGSAAQYIRDMFAMNSARAMGMIASHGTFVHLYLNGQYWGMYNPVERPDASFSATYRGGDKDSWDAINQGEVSSGDSAAWDRLFSMLSLDMSVTANYQRVQGNNPDGTRNPAYEDLVDVPNLVDYMILNFYIGNADWPGRNWWVGRDRNDGDGFHFYPWDSETALDISGLDADTTGAADAVAHPYALLRTNAEFRLTFADHVFRHFFNDGAFYVNPTNSVWNPAHPENNRPAARFAAAAALVDRAIVGESARWGDQLGSGPYTRDEQWQPRRDGILRDYFPYRTAKVLAQFRRVGLYPNTDPPIMNQHGGTVGPGFALSMTALQGIIYYTTNGSDPRTPISGLPTGALRYTGAIPVTDLMLVKARVLNGSEWSALNEATFTVGTPILAVSELNYHPADPTPAERALGFTDSDNFEFIELVNSGSTTFDLNGVEFINGVHFSFTNSAVNALPAGAFVLVVKNRAAFEARYGTGLPIAGEYSGQFDNAGERVTIVDAKGATLIDFSYGTDLPWPASADGSGYSLEVINSGANLSLPSNWHASATTGGSPGKVNPVPAPKLSWDASTPGLLRLRFDGRGGSSYTAYFTDSLPSGQWTVMQRVNTLIDDQPVELSIALSNTPSSRFYRVSTP